MNTLTLWTRRDPFAEVDALFRTFLPAQPARPTPAGPRVPARAAVRTGAFVPPAEIVRDGEDAVVRLELPGLDVEKDVTVELEGRRLVVRGERRDERAEDLDGRRLREVRYGAFRRGFTLPQHVTDDAVSATYEAGVLVVRVAGAHAGPQPRRITVTAPMRSADGPAEEGTEQASGAPAA